MRDKQRIRTSNDYPPIPDRRFDWSAVFDDYDGAEDAGFQPIGRGRTEQEAIDDLREQVEERSPLANVPMPWCERCQGWHHGTADHVEKDIGTVQDTFANCLEY